MKYCGLIVITGLLCLMLSGCEEDQFSSSTQPLTPEHSDSQAQDSTWEEEPQMEAPEEEQTEQDDQDQASSQQPAQGEYVDDKSPVLKPDQGDAQDQQPDPKTGEEQSYVVDSPPATGSVTDQSQISPTELRSARRSQPSQGLDTMLIEDYLFQMINEERRNVGLEPLTIDDSMQWAARIRAEEVLQSMSHTRPGNTPYYTAFDEAGYSYAGKWHGENIARFSFTPGTQQEKQIAQEMYNGLAESPGHYQNMMGEHFLLAGIGVGAQYDSDMTTVASAQLFSSR